jgi:hypothetical protein
MKTTSGGWVAGRRFCGTYVHAGRRRPGPPQKDADRQNSGRIDGRGFAADSGRCPHPPAPTAPPRPDNRLNNRDVQDKLPDVTCNRNAAEATRISGFCTLPHVTKKPDREDPAKFDWKCRLRLNLQRGTLMSANGRRTRSGDGRYMCSSCPKNKQEFFKPPMQKGIGFHNASKPYAGTHVAARELTAASRIGPKSGDRFWINPVRRQERWSAVPIPSERPACSCGESEIRITFEQRTERIRIQGAALASY